MKKNILLGIAVLAFLFSSCRNRVWGGDGELVVEEVRVETNRNHADMGRYVVTCRIVRGYGETIGSYFADNIYFNTDSLYHVGDTIYIR